MTEVYCYKILFYRYIEVDKNFNTDNIILCSKCLKWIKNSNVDTSYEFKILTHADYLYFYKNQFIIKRNIVKGELLLVVNLNYNNFPNHYFVFTIDKIIKVAKKKKYK